MAERREKLTVSLALILHRGEVLLLRRRDEDIPEFHNYWELPGGKVEPGETSQEAAIREAREETGYQVKTLEQAPFHYRSLLDLKTPPLEVDVTCWLCEPRTDTGRPIPGTHENTESVWIPLGAVGEANVIPGSREFLLWAMARYNLGSADQYDLYTVEMQSVDYERNRRRHYQISLTYHPHSEPRNRFLVRAWNGRIYKTSRPSLALPYSDLPEALSEIAFRLEKRRRNGYQVTSLPERHPLRSWLQARGLMPVKPPIPTLDLEF